MTLITGPNLGQLVHGDPGEEHYAHLIKQWRALDALVQARVKSASTTTPPAAPADGDCYIVPAGATGLWAGHVGSIARWSGLLEEWEFYSPKDGWAVWVGDSEHAVRFDGSAWKQDTVRPETGPLLVATWNELAGIVGDYLGQEAQVPVSDEGTHVDPLTSEGVPNAGQYSLTGSGWHWLGTDVLSAKADQTLVDEVAGRQLSTAEEFAAVDMDGSGRVSRVLHKDGTTEYARLKVGGLSVAGLRGSLGGSLTDAVEVWADGAGRVAMALMRDGTLRFSGAPTPVVGSSTVYVSTSGNDDDDGSKASPLATLSAAISRIDGRGVVYLFPGDYGVEQRFLHTLVTGHVRIIGLRNNPMPSGSDWPIVRLNNKIAGITKTPGRSKVYQATVSGLPELGSYNWCYQDGVPDPRTLIPDDDRSPQHRGRTHRLMGMARLLKTNATTLSEALEEIDAAPDDLPLSFIDSGVLYFSVAGGGDGTDADIYLSGTSLVSGVSASVIGASGIISIQGLEVRYGGMDLRAFNLSELDEVFVYGARNDCVDYHVLRYSTLEVACSGDRHASAGDGLNGHDSAVILEGNDLYAHDCWDDGFSDHEGSSSRMLGGGLVEYNGGAGLAPAFGSDHVSRGFVSRRNQQRPGRKPGAFAVVGQTTTDPGVDTLAWFFDCIDYGSRKSFHSVPGELALSAVCVGCRSINPIEMGFDVSKIIDCGFSDSTGNAVARSAETVVENTTRIE